MSSATSRTLKSVFERIRFARYAWRFERAFKTDVWGPVTACFAPDAVYSCEDAPPPFGGEYRGPDSIVGLFRDLVNRYDRKFERRIPRLEGLPRVRDGALVMKWSATYVSRIGNVVLHGTSRCRFAGGKPPRRGKIIELRDTMVRDELLRWRDLAEQLSGVQRS